jgi:uncharacterized protein (DUF983 family)
MDQQALDPEMIREIQDKKKAEDFTSEIFFDAIIMIVCVIFVIVNNKKDCNLPIPMWLSVYVGSYLADMIITMYQLHWLKKTRKDNIYLMGARYLTLVF